ncbi:glycosyltransferase [Arthrobacter gengyunqii]|uniref:Glycosyltransferase n=1 Tax=Arthrobacter gengyunqii TaxID=2886940 RepID=A0A9X1S6K2_9MICC|nr:glycosyltransferase [Arthrobacter gengyunqii]MCC3269893.1 glycosyltransferase [Arthrobacter gengyunqii]UOY95175.1 glycosyltransferase [Arthrobacter gengyunqii]
MENDVDVSVVIGFKDWGLNRLSLAVTSIQNSFGKLRGEVIVSDYGSLIWESTKARMEELGVKYVRTSTDGTWSRSRALNAGFAVSSGRVLISTDADMVFSPRSMELIASKILRDPTLCILLQCRDLPEEWSDESIAQKGMMWEVFEKEARLRPRWGMGGMMAVPRTVFMRIRGLDERMHTYGGEDIDFATRARRSGQRLLWIDDPDIRMYHMWHPPTRKVHEHSASAAAAIQFNKDIVYNDRTFVRNTPKWVHRPSDAAPLVTVAISTYNRSQYLRESIISVLAQTMQDFEIVVVDDGSTDDTRKVVESFDDERIRYIYQPNSGISVARNAAADASRGAYTVVQDDDDLMTPWRLEKHFEHLSFGSHGTFGSFVNFDNSSGEMKLYASKKLNDGTVFSTGGAPGHGTWMVETDLLRTLRYDETLTSGVDNNMALRLVRSGAVLHHTGEIMMLRRIHDGQITVEEEEAQQTSARQTRQMFAHQTSEWAGKKLEAERGVDDYVPVRLAKQLNELIPYLPDHLVHRTVLFSNQTAADVSFEGAHIGPQSSVVQEFDGEGALISSTGSLGDALSEDLAKLSRAGIGYEVKASLRSSHDSGRSQGLGPEAMFRSAVHSSLEAFAVDYAGGVGSSVAALRGHLDMGEVGTARELRVFNVSGSKRKVTFLAGVDLPQLLSLSESKGFSVQEIIINSTVSEALPDTGSTEPVRMAGQQ